MPLLRVPTLWLAILAVSVQPASIVYVTDLEIFTSLAPCASYAVSYGVFIETYSSRCGDSQTALQTCICSNSNEFKQVTNNINADLSSTCGTGAGTSDTWSASVVMARYCSLDEAITFPKPSNVVNAYITELSQMSYLPHCAQSALSYAVMADMADKCPKDASLFAPCVCNSHRAKGISETLSKSVRLSCTNDQDVTAAQAFYNEYCAMNSGTTSFAAPQGPPGDVSYYITALPQYKALRSCAQSAVSSAVLDQTAWNCASGPQALASCACLKSGMRGKVSSSLTSQVKGYCSSTAIDDVTSAISVWEYYCSAAENKVVATVSESVSQTGATGVPSRTQPSAPLASQTGDSAGGNGGNGNTGGTNKTGVIVASVLGAIVAVVAAAGLFFFFRRRNQRTAKEEQISRTEELDTLSKHPYPSVDASIPELSTPSHMPRPELYPNATLLPAELPPEQCWGRAELQGGGPQHPTSASSEHQVGAQYAVRGYGGDGSGPRGGEVYELGMNMPGTS
ncbi:uncharacterized protein UV8b_08283 [Ustilaginoidea virens]|uniref:Extracellular membrane protein CFEM domain-containing protein n=1 Tax=Ustilaginoidea virens TaxID=1159556 RepID=A0A063BNR8_USTVR|nr:uncharacterized protein UV8b_08283 [Ustilaginoidea virens]QUC24042.1 hypothetical protein UV8b_08283 [Ustilaginoidea virens]GAO19188.1 hypothetical protein UVI_02063580 [Ustilaginoidea virens]